MGATVNKETLEQLSCGIICGAANNQLAVEVEDGQRVLDKGILYAPDYLVNAGGIINCYWEIVGYNRQASLAQAEMIYDTTRKIYSASKENGIPTYLAANQMAEQRIQSIANIKTRY
jgi:leucine dehydrogenase